MASFSADRIVEIHRQLHSQLPSEPALRVKALESVLVEKGLLDSRTVDAWVEAFTEVIGPKRGAQVVARAWVDLEYKARLTGDAAAAINELGYLGHATSHLKIVENMDQVHNLVVKDNRVVAVGFNGFPSDVVDMPERLDDREVKYEMVVHAEVNALLIAGQRADGATIYVQGRPVCASCAGAIIQSGVQRVVAEPPPAEGDGKWDKSGRIARTMFAEADRHFDPYPHDCLNAGAKPEATMPKLKAAAAQAKTSARRRAR